MDVGPNATRGHLAAQGIAVIRAASQQHVSIAQSIEHVQGTAALGRLALCEFKRDWKPIGINQRVEFGSQTGA